MNRVGALVRSDETAGEILRPLHGAVAADENSIALHRRFPFRRETDDRRALKFLMKKVWQVDIRHLDVAADQRLFLLMARWVGQLDHFHVKALRLHLPYR